MLATSETLSQIVVQVLVIGSCQAGRNILQALRIRVISVGGNNPIAVGITGQQIQSIKTLGGIKGFLCAGARQAF